MEKAFCIPFYAQLLTTQNTTKLIIHLHASHKFYTTSSNTNPYQKRPHFKPPLNFSTSNLSVTSLRPPVSISTNHGQLHGEATPPDRFEQVWMQLQFRIRRRFKTPPVQVG